MADDPTDMVMRGCPGGGRAWRARAVATALASALVVGGCAWRAPDFDTALPALAQSSRILAADGSVLVELDGVEDREYVRLDSLPAHVPDAVVAIEDSRFWSHTGVDGKAVIRAALANAEGGGVVEGGSTITQQYVKTVLLQPERSLARKLEEAALAVQLEGRYSKERILELYLNTIYFGNGAYGVQAAALRYFDVPASALDLAQAATLAGLIRSPVTTDPYSNPAEAKARRDLVLARMAELGLVEQGVVDVARAGPLLYLAPEPEARYPAPHFVEHVKRFVLDDPRFGATPAERRALLFGGGLRITTTLDPNLQRLAEASVDRVRPPEPGPDAALIAVEPASGFVRALVGGRDFFGADPEARVDLAAGGAGRPAGSSFKPLVLAAALEQGTRLDRLYSAPPRIEIPLADEVWEVENYGESAPAEGEVTLAEATVRSYNTVYAQLIQEVGPEEAMAMASRLGVASPLQPYPSAVLGTNDVRPLDMAAAYATFANRGVRVAPSFVTRIVQADGQVLFAHEHLSSRVISAGLADDVTGVLRGVVEGGTGTRAAIGRPAAGKTGTGQGWTDAWFVGYTPDLVAAVWMGYPEEGRRAMVPPATPIRVTGGSWPAEIWAGFMGPALEGVPPSDFAAAPAAGGPAVDDVVGLPFEVATEALRRSGFLVERRDVRRDWSPAGTVATSTPGAGASAPVGSTVVVEVADGRASTVVVPDLLGLLPSEAAALAQGSELVVAAGVLPPPDLIASGRSWQQEPLPGTRVPIGATVTILVSPDPAPLVQLVGPAPEPPTSTEPAATAPAAPPTTAVTPPPAPPATVPPSAPPTTAPLGPPAPPAPPPPASSGVRSPGELISSSPGGGGPG